MGLVPDSSVLIAGERRNESVREILLHLRAKHGETDVGISTVSIVELTHGIYRAKTDIHHLRRQAFTEEVCRDVVVYPVTLEIAKRAGQIEAEQMVRGISIAFQDLLIGCTALELNYSIVTLNSRHFEPIPGLHVISPLS
jgi:tRNA(fMet)-specific endonuclease VapC